jgi:hypothetical protein
MGIRVRVTGYIDPEPDEIDSDDPTGLTEAAFLVYACRLSCLDDLDFEAEND